MELNIGSVLLPRFSLLSSERQALEQWCESQKKSWYRDRSKSISSRQDACAYLIEGLYQAWCCITPKTALEIPFHSGSYHSSRFDAINHLSHQFVHVAIDGLEALGWVREHYLRSAATWPPLGGACRIAPSEKVFPSP